MYLERRGEKVGLNLTEEVLDGIGKHSKNKGGLAGWQDLPFTLEGQIVRYCDRLAKRLSEEAPSYFPAQKS